MRTPPNRGPSTLETAKTIPFNPEYFPLSRTVTISTIMIWFSEFIAPPPIPGIQCYNFIVIPCNARKIMREIIFGATAQSIDPTIKNTTAPW